MITRTLSNSAKGNVKHFSCGKSKKQHEKEEPNWPNHQLMFWEVEGGEGGGGGGDLVSTIIFLPADKQGRYFSSP